MGFGLHFGGALAGVGQEAYKQRQQQHEDEINQQTREWSTLANILQNAAPEYQQVGFQHMLDYAMAKPGTGGDKQRQSATSSILQLLGGQGPEIQSKTTELSGHPLLDYNAPQASAGGPAPQGLINLGGMPNGPSTDQPTSLMNRMPTPQFGAPLQPQGPVPSMQGSQMNTNQQSSAMASSVPQIITQGGQANPVSVKTPIPFLEDPVARKIREAKGMVEPQSELYGLKRTADTQKTIDINRDKARVGLAAKLAFLDPQTRAQTMVYANRGLAKRVIENGGSMENPADVQDAVDEIAAETKQRFDERAGRIQKLKDDGILAKGRLQSMQENTRLRSEELNLRKTTAANAQQVAADRAANEQRKSDVVQLNKRYDSAQKEVDRIGRDPRLLAPDKYPEVSKQFDAAEKKVQDILNDIQSAGEGKAGAAIEERQDAAGASKGGGVKLATGQGVGETVKVGGKNVRITKIHPDGKTFDYEAIP